MAAALPPATLAPLRTLAALALAALVLAAGCRGGDGPLRARRVALTREVEGLRAAVAKLERGEPILPEQAALVAIAEGVVAEFLNAELPVEVEVESFRIRMERAEASFRGSPSVRLTGSVRHVEHPDLEGDAAAVGTLDSIQVDGEAGTLRAQITVDHVELLRAGALEGVVGAGTKRELARQARQRLQASVPKVQIPVEIERGIALPAVTSGPVRIRSAWLPLQVSVADVLAADGLLWIAIDVTPGELVREETVAKGGPR